MSTRDPSRKYDSVQQDWRAFLPESKAAFFCAHTSELRNSYFAFSVSLDEAIGLRHARSLPMLGDSVIVSSELCSRFALRLTSILHGMRQRARHFGILPNFDPLVPGNFRTERGQRAARSSTLVGKILLSKHSEFLHKVVTLERVVDSMETDYCCAISENAAPAYWDAGNLWRTLDGCHFDLTTCLEEAIVLFKSFLFVLPETQLDDLDFTIRGLYRSRRPSREVGAHIIRPRRISAVAGK